MTKYKATNQLQTLGRKNISRCKSEHRNENDAAMVLSLLLAGAL